MRCHTAELEDTLGGDYPQLIAEQAERVGQLNKDLQELSVLLGQSYMTQNLKEYALDLNHYQRVIYVSDSGSDSGVET